jgi:predicted nucleotidyltransferase
MEYLTEQNMLLTEQEKKSIKKELVDSLCHEPEISKIVVFGSFLVSSDPHDLDVAVFQTSNQSYLPLALRYRKITRSIASRIALDILPIREGVKDSVMLESIFKGEVIYER